MNRNNFLITNSQPEDLQERIEGYGDLARTVGGMKLTTKVAQHWAREWGTYRRVCSEVDVPFYVGGGVFEAFAANGDTYRLVQALHGAEIDTIEISNPSGMSPNEFIEIARQIRRDFDRVFVEIGEKSCTDYPLHWWMRHMFNAEAVDPDAIILEGSTGCNVGIYASGRPNDNLVGSMVKVVRDDIPVIVEAYSHGIQEHWIRKFGPEVCLGNIDATIPDDLEITEAIRDSFRSRRGVVLD